MTQWRLEPNAKAAGAVRHAAVASLLQKGVAPLDDVALVIAELLANAIAAARSFVVLDVTLAGGQVFVSVSDDGPGFATPATASPPPLEAESSRGLYLVQTLARGFQVNRTARRTTVHCWLPVRAVATPA